MRRPGVRIDEDLDHQRHRQQCQSREPAGEADDEQHGKEVFAENCQCCHSLGLPKIGNEPAPELDPQPSDLLFIQDYKYGSSEHDMAAIICYGIEGTGMAPWDGILEPEDIWAVAFYVASQQKKKRVDHK